MCLKSKVSFNPFYDNINPQTQSEIDDRTDYPSTYSQDMKKWENQLNKFMRK